MMDTDFSAAVRQVVLSHHTEINELQDENSRLRKVVQSLGGHVTTSKRHNGVDASSTILNEIDINFKTERVIGDEENDDCTDTASSVGSDTHYIPRKLLVSGTASDAAVSNCSIDACLETKAMHGVGQEKKHEIREDDATKSESYTIATEAKECQEDLSPKTSISRNNTNKLASLLSHEKHSLVEGTALQNFVRSSKFELLSISCILLNTCLMACEIQFRGMILGTKIKVDGYSVSLSWVDPFFFASSVVFSIIFVTELCLRLYVLRCDARYNAWMWLDGFLVSFGIIDILTVAKVFRGIGFNPSMLRVIRLVRLMRVIKTLKASKGAFHSLFLLLKSLQASCTAAVWSMIVILLMCLSVGMALNQLTAPHIEEGLPLEDRKELFKYFGTFTRTMLTMFEITLGNWAPPTRLLTDNLSELWGVLMVIYRNVFCFAVVNVMRAVFIMETTRVAASDDEVAMMNNDRHHGSLESKLRSVFELIDSDGDGALTLSEFEVAMQHEKVMKYLKTLQVEGRLLPQYLFQLLATQKDGDEEPTVHCDDFVSNVCALRGDAKSIDLNIGLWLIGDIKQSIDALRTESQARHIS